MKPASLSQSLRILVLGGTGFTGPYQVRYALERGHHVTIFNRGGAPQQWPREVEVLSGDRDKGDLASLAGREWDVCIDNPASLPFWVRDAGRALAGRTGHYIFISTVSVYADASRPGLDETAPLLAYDGANVMAETHETMRADMGLYGPLKAACEREAARHFAGRLTIIRPSLIVGPGDETDRFTYWPVRIAAGGDVLAPPAKDAMQLIDARDLAEWTVRMAEQRRVGIYNAATPGGAWNMEQGMREIRAAVKSDARLVFTNADFLATQGVAMWQDLPGWVPGEGPMAGFLQVSCDRAVAAGLTFRPLAATAAETLAWFREQPAERQARLRAGLSRDREVAALQAWAARA